MGRKARSPRVRRATLEYREVGNTGVQVSEIGFGGGGNAGLMVRGTPEQQREAVARAIELGINYFDQSPDYGDGVSETNLGRLMKELAFRPYLTTKIEVRAENLDDIAGHVTRSLDESLQRLGVDYVDFLQIHNGPLMERPELSGRAYARLWIEDYLRPGGALEGLQRAQGSGKARFIGFITRGGDGDAARQLIDTGVFSLINVSVHLLNPSASVKPDGMRFDADWDGILNHAAANGVGAAIYSPLAGWFLTDNAAEGGAAHPLARGSRSPEVDAEGLHCARALRFLSRNLSPDTQEEDHNLAQAALRFVLSLNGVSTVLG
ncbi:MAG: aldo/keto reductase, partial [Chloroflexi bacterium]|nr:aldo/keto reductase [Chloroflexota bacterium]